MTKHKESIRINELTELLDTPDKIETIDQIMIESEIRSIEKKNTRHSTEEKTEIKIKAIRRRHKMKDKDKRGCYRSKLSKKKSIWKKATEKSLRHSESFALKGNGYRKILHLESEFNEQY